MSTIIQAWPREVTGVKRLSPRLEISNSTYLIANPIAGGAGDTVGQ